MQNNPSFNPCPACANHLPRKEMLPDAQSPLDQLPPSAEEEAEVPEGEEV